MCTTASCPRQSSSQCWRACTWTPSTRALAGRMCIVQAFTDSLLSATDLPAFIVQTHSGNALMADQLRLAVDGSINPTRKTSEEMDEEAALFRLNEQWLAFKRRPTVFHASRFCSIWKALDLQIQLEDDLGVCPISGPLLLGGRACVKDAVPVCRRILEQRITALRDKRRLKAIHIQHGVGPVNVLSPNSSIIAPLTASDHALLNVGGKDATAAGGNISNTVTTSISVSRSIRLSPIRRLVSTVQRGSEVCRVFQPEAELSAEIAALIQRDDERRQQEALVNDASFDNNLPAVAFHRDMLLAIRSVLKVRDAPWLDAYAANFDPQAINDEYMTDYSGPFASATAFIISPRLLLTNYHVFPTAASAGHEATRLCFDYDEEEHKHGLGELRPKDFFFSDRELDFAVVAFTYPDAEYVNADAAAGELADQRRRQPLVLRRRLKPLDDVDMRLVVVGHPGGKVKQVSLPGCMMLLSAPEPSIPGQQPQHIMLYSNDTQCGSSGSPVLNMHWQLLGLHHSALRDSQGLLARVRNTLLRTTLRQYNQGTPTTAIWETLMKQFVKCKAEYQAAQHVEANARAMQLLRDCLMLDTELSRAAKDKLQ